MASGTVCFQTSKWVYTHIAFLKSNPILELQRSTRIQICPFRVQIFRQTSSSLYCLLFHHLTITYEAASIAYFCHSKKVWDKMLSYAGVQMFMDKLYHLINCYHIPSINNRTIKRQRSLFKLLYDELDNPIIQTLFIHQHQHLQKVNDLNKRFTDAVQEAQYIVDMFLSGVHISNDGNATRLPKCVADLFASCFVYIGDVYYFPASLNLDHVFRSFNVVKVELISMSIMDSSRITLNQSVAAAAPVSVTRGSEKLYDEVVVGLEYDVELIRDKLVEDQKKVDVVSIVGMGGIGKTTLATKVFIDPFIMYHFHVRVWVTVSQTYDKRNVLIQILEFIRGQLDLQKENSESRLREMVHKHLMGRRYLIVIDDIWHIETWDNLKLFFPHDDNGSRILLTSRLTEVATHANSNGLIHHIGYMSKERSWELLCQKVFHGDQYPEWAYDLGMQIVENCKRLPLAVAIIAGVLAKGARSEKFWVEIAKSTGSYIVGDQNGCLESLGLSYNHLPLHLRECFLYLGVFREDYKYNVRRLIWLWMAEGFIEQDGKRSLEDIAEGYLMDLIDRSLVIVTHRNSSGGVKVCKVHDLVRELCLKKGKEEGFFNQFPIDINISIPPYKPARMFVDEDIRHIDFPYPFVKNVRAVMWFSRLSDDITRCFHSFVLLRVLDIRNYKLNGFTKQIELLVHLRYLAIYVKSKDFPSSICNLWNLQTLIFDIAHEDRSIILPSNLSDLVNLRHLWTSGEVFILPSIERPMMLQTILGVELGDGVRNLQKWFPYLKKLRCSTSSYEEYDFKSLTYLEKLNLNDVVENNITFPASLKTLTLVWSFLQWSDMSMIRPLPNLQVLKLNRSSFRGRCWNTDGLEFPKLKFLRLRALNIKQWEAYSTSFPCLRQLEVFYCHVLEEIPLEIGEITTLELIKIKGCRPSVGESVRRIQEEQHDLGNYNLKIEVLK